MIHTYIKMKKGDDYITLVQRGLDNLPSVGHRIVLELNDKGDTAELLVHKVTHKLFFTGGGTATLYCDIVNLYDKNDIDPPLSDIGI